MGILHMSEDDFKEHFKRSNVIPIRRPKEEKTDEDDLRQKQGSTPHPGLETSQGD